MAEDLERILSKLSQPDNAVIQQVMSEIPPQLSVVAYVINLEISFICLRSQVVFFIGYSPAEAGFQRPSHYTSSLYCHHWLHKSRGIVFVWEGGVNKVNNYFTRKFLWTNVLSVKLDSPQIRQSASVMLRLRVKKHWKKINPNDKERFSILFLYYPHMLTPLIILFNSF